MIKNILGLVGLSIALVPASARAYSGDHALTCKSVNSNGSSPAIVFTLERANATGWFAPTYSITIDGKKFDFKGADDTKSDGETIHDGPLGLVYITANNLNEGALSEGVFTVKAIPNTVKTVDQDGKPITWSLDGENNSCLDVSGKTTFQGVLQGYIRVRANLNPDANVTETSVNATLMNCELDYDPGMAC